MARVINLPEIKQSLKRIDAAALIREGFVAYSQGRVVVPPVGEMIFEDPPGETHIKYGYIKGDDYYVVKIASGFFSNPDLGLPSNSGLMLLFSQKTGAIQSVLLDEGYLTDVRTALAGQVAAERLAPQKVRAIGVLGTGIQARMQVEYLKPVTDCREVIVWGRSPDKAGQYKEDLEQTGFRVRVAGSPEEVAAEAGLIVTATPAREPLLMAGAVQPGTHITAMGSDTADKQELDPEILGRADLVVADSISQCLERGEIHQALKAGRIEERNVVELGGIIAEPTLGRTSEEQVTVADLTGVAVQDLQIAKAVFLEISASEGETS